MDILAEAKALPREGALALVLCCTLPLCVHASVSHAIFLTG